MIHQFFTNFFAISVLAIPTIFILSTAGYGGFVIGEYKNSEKAVPTFLMLLTFRMFMLALALLLIYTGFFNYSDYGSFGTNITKIITTHNKFCTLYCTSDLMFVIPILWSVLIVIDTFLTNRELYVIYKSIDKKFLTNREHKNYLLKQLQQLRPFLYKVNNFRYILYVLLCCIIFIEFFITGYFTALELLFGLYVYVNYKIFIYVNRNSCTTK